MNDLTNIIWQPLLDPWLIITLAIVLALIFIYMVWVNKRLPFFRILFSVVLVLLLLNPVLQKISGSLTDTIINVFVDHSDSQRLSDRRDNVDQIESDVVEKISSIKGVDVQVEYIDNTANKDRTVILPTLKNLLSAQNPKQVGGTLLITDGHIADAQIAGEQLKNYGPLHVIMAGDPDQEFDRRIKILSAPDYVVVGENLPVSFRIDEYPNVKTQTQKVRVFLDDKVLQVIDTPVGEEMQVNIPVDRPGETLLRFVVETDAEELSAVNNTAILPIQGVRARLKVLLVSGQPHQGLRIWRNLLKSDPAVDLVHFTILRSYDSIDITPPDQLALIPFPTEELFQERIKDFDLIIFDRYTRRNILLPQYFDNIVSFVREGGGLLMVHGPEEAQSLALSDTSLRDVLPYTRIENAVNTNSFQPEISTFGIRHPITSELRGQNNWGRWGRFINMDRKSESSRILMQTSEDQAPLLIIDEVEDGRIAQFTSEQVWLWARGYNGGGPYGTVMKRLAHWLMKEPTLDYKPLKISSTDEGVKITYEGENAPDSDLTLNLPTGENVTLSPEVTEPEDGLYTFEQTYKTQTSGYYSVQYGDEQAYVVKGQLNSPEYQMLVSDEEQPLKMTSPTNARRVEYSNWQDVGFSLTSSSRYFSGSNLAFKESTQIENRTVETQSLLPWWLAAFLGFVFLIFGWLRQE